MQRKFNEWHIMKKVGTFDTILAKFPMVKREEWLHNQ